MLNIQQNSHLQKLADTDCTILITGQTGTGKSNLAEQIHRRSKRRAQRFVSINLATINENLIESELFGHERGAFSSANFKRMGKFELANGGTVFLDEIGELSLSAQMRLLEALNSKTICPVGSNRELKLDIRIITATNKNLQDMTKNHAFRNDLFYRINTFQIDLPSLQQVPELIPQYAEIFRVQYAKSSSDVSEENLHFSDCFREFISRYNWPGNLRELKNAIEYAAAVCSEGLIKSSDLPPYILSSEVGVQSANHYFPVNYYEAKNNFERAYLVDMLKMFGGKINLTSRKTQLSKVTLIEKIRRYNIDVSAVKIDAYQNTKQPDFIRFL